VWAERAGRQTPWNPEHIAERYGLFTIIVLGECVLAATTAVQAALAASGVSAALLAVAVGGLVLVFAMWWAYFKVPAAIGHHLALRWQVAWGYGHYVIFAAIAALGAGLQVASDAITDPRRLPSVTAAMTVAIPVAVYLVAVGLLHRRGNGWSSLAPVSVTSLLVMAAAVAAGFVGVPIAVLGDEHPGQRHRGGQRHPVPAAGGRGVARTNGSGIARGLEHQREPGAGARTARSGAQSGGPSPQPEMSPWNRRSGRASGSVLSRTTTRSRT
jgi:hypothetical protein